MKKLRVYIDTSVIGGCFDDEFALWSNGLLEDFKKDRFEPVISTLTAEEILNAPENVRKVFQQFVELAGEVLEPNDEVAALMEYYQKRKILGKRFRNDMLHVAIATVNKVDLVVSWNFKHIVHFDKNSSVQCGELGNGLSAIDYSFTEGGDLL